MDILNKMNLVQKIKDGRKIHHSDGALWELNMGQLGDIDLATLQERQDKRIDATRDRMEKARAARKQNQADEPLCNDITDHDCVMALHTTPQCHYTPLCNDITRPNPSLNPIKPKGDEEKASSSSAGGKAPPESSPRAKPTSKGNSKNKLRGELEDYFAKITNIPKLKYETKTQKTKAAVRWWNPLVEILDMTDWNLTQAQSLVSMAYKQMKKDDLTVCAPQSILNVAISLHADGRVGANGKRTIQV